MAHTKQIAKNKWQYKCTCGKTVELEQETKPEKLQKCFDCQLTYEEVKDYVEISV